MLTAVTSRAERAAEVASLYQAGRTGTEIAKMLGLSRSYTYSLIHDPDGTQDRARKDSYAGVCETCGGPTSGADGPAEAPRFCRHCAPAHYQTKYWTYERVVAAIQLWAELHDGRPPRATDWLKGAKRRNVNGHKFPPASAVYRGSGLASAPFEYWADAIEAAGFPRPQRGQYERTPTMPGRGERTYLVFTVNGDGSLKLFGETDAPSNQEAIEALATDAGTYASVAKGSLQTFTLKPRLVATKVPVEA